MSYEIPFLELQDGTINIAKEPKMGKLQAFEWPSAQQKLEKNGIFYGP